MLLLLVLTLNGCSNQKEEKETLDTKTETTSSEETSVEESLESEVSGNTVFEKSAIAAGIETYDTDEEHIALKSDDFCLIAEYDDMSYASVYKDLGIFVFDESGKIIQCLRRQKMEPKDEYVEFVPGYESDLVYEECEPIELALYYGVDLSDASKYPSQKELFLYKEYTRKQNDAWKYQTVFMSNPNLSQAQLGDEILVKLTDFSVPETVFKPESDDYMVEESEESETYVTASGAESVISFHLINCYEYDEAGKVIKGTRVLDFENEATASEYVNTRGGEQREDYVLQEIADINNLYKRNSINCSKPLTLEQLEKQYAVIPIS